MKWFLIWVIVSQNPATNDWEWTATLDEKQSYSECIKHLAIKDTHFEDIKKEDPTFQWQTFCVTEDEINFDQINRNANTK